MALTSILNEVSKPSKDRLGTPKAERIEIEDIRPNKFNKFPISEVKELAENIKQFGLMKPLEVYDNDDGYVLLGGQRRWTALNYLVDEFDYESRILCLVYPKPKDILAERLANYRSNMQRGEMTSQDYINLVGDLDEIYYLLDEKPIGQKRDWIAKQLGFKSGKSIQKYLNQAKGNPEVRKREKDPAEELYKVVAGNQKKISKIYDSLSQERLKKKISLDGKQIELQQAIDLMNRLSEAIIESQK